MLKINSLFSMGSGAESCAPIEMKIEGQCMLNIITNNVIQRVDVQECVSNQIHFNL